MIAYTVECPPHAAPFMAELVALARRVFARVDEGYVEWRLAHLPDPSVVLATDGDRRVGFKAGYAVSQRKYYSWLGGVVPEYRERRIASGLMDRQHEWVAARGYEVIETATEQENASMARLNLRHGYRTCGLRTEPRRVQVLFSKRLR